MKNEYQLGYQSPYACTVCKKYTIVSYRNTANAIITKKNNNSQFLGNVYTVKIIPSVLLTHAPYSYCKKYYQYKNVTVVQFRRKMTNFYRAMLCIRGTSHGPVSVCLSVCLSQVGVLLKQLNTGSHKQHHTIAQGL